MLRLHLKQNSNSASLEPKMKRKDLVEPYVNHAGISKRVGRGDKPMLLSTEHMMLQLSYGIEPWWRIPSIEKEPPNR